MGLLDDAIREHLELKRRSGADPGEIAHKEHEALAPVFPDEETVAVEAPGEPMGADSLADEPPLAADIELAEDGRGPAAEGDFTHVGQETAELDMRLVLDGHEDSPVAPVGPVRTAQVPVEAEGDSAAWELEPSADGASGDAPPPEEIPGQERLTFE